MFDRLHANIPLEACFPRPATHVRTADVFSSIFLPNPSSTPGLGSACRRCYAGRCFPARTFSSFITVRSVCTMRAVGARTVPRGRYEEAAMHWRSDFQYSLQDSGRRPVILLPSQSTPACLLTTNATAFLIRSLASSEKNVASSLPITQQELGRGRRHPGDWNGPWREGPDVKVISDGARQSLRSWRRGCTDVYNDISNSHWTQWDKARALVHCHGKLLKISSGFGTAVPQQVLELWNVWQNGGDLTSPLEKNEFRRPRVSTSKIRWQAWKVTRQRGKDRTFSLPCSPALRILSPCARPYASIARFPPQLSKAGQGPQSTVASLSATCLRQFAPALRIGSRAVSLLSRITAGQLDTTDGWTGSRDVCCCMVPGSSCWSLTWFQLWPEPAISDSHHCPTGLDQSRARATLPPAAHSSVLAYVLVRSWNRDSRAAKCQWEVKRARESRILSQPVWQYLIKSYMDANQSGHKGLGPSGIKMLKYYIMYYRYPNYLSERSSTCCCKSDWPFTWCCKWEDITSNITNKVFIKRYIDDFHWVRWC